MGVNLSILRRPKGRYFLAKKLHEHLQEIHTLAISPDGKYLASGGKLILILFIRMRFHLLKH